MTTTQILIVMVITFILGIGVGMLITDVIDKLRQLKHTWFFRHRALKPFQIDFSKKRDPK